MLGVFMMWPHPGVVGSAEGPGRGRQKWLWSVRSSWYTEHGEVGVLSYGRGAKLCCCLWSNSFLSSETQQISLEMYACEWQIPNLDWPSVEMEFISLCEGGEPWAAPAKLEGGAPSNVIRPQCHRYFLSLLSLMSTSFRTGLPCSLRSV